MELNEKLAVSVREAAMLLSVSARTIQNYISEKIIPARKIGRRTVVPMRALENFLRADRPSPAVKSHHEAPSDVAGR